MKRSELSPIYAWRRAPSMLDYSGHLSAVLFTAGCNFRCGFCHNASLFARKRDGMPWPRLYAQCHRWQAEWVTAAVITGGEPTLCEDLPKLVAALKSFGWRIKLDTNGSLPGVLNDCIDMVDYVAMDVKAGLSAYPGLTGYPHPEHITASIAVVKSRAKDYEFRTTIINHVHTDDHMEELIGMIAGARRYVMQPYVPRDDVLERSFRTLARTPPERLHALAERLRGRVDELTVRG